jgi:hypothetical protein
VGERQAPTRLPASTPPARGVVERLVQTEVMTLGLTSDPTVRSPPFARPATIPELYLLMRHFNDRAIAGATIDQLSWLLRPSMSGHKVMMRTLGPGTRLFRGRVMTTPPTNLREVGYPPASLVREDGRANRVGESMLYVTTSGAAVAFETRAKVGDMLAVIEYEVTTVLPYMALGYTRLAAARLGSTREVPDYGIGLTTGAPANETGGALHRHQSRADVHRAPAALHRCGSDDPYVAKAITSLISRGRRKDSSAARV